MEVDLDAANAAPQANDTDGTAPPGTLKIGCLAPLKTPTGQAVKAAIEMAIAQTAAKRLPSGFEVSLICADTDCTDVGALYAARKLARANVVAIVGDVCTPATMAAMAVANRFQIPLVSPGATSPDLTTEGSYFFRTVPNDRYQGRFVAEQLKRQGASTVLVAYTPDNYSDRLAFNFVAAFSRDGGLVVPLALQPGAPGGAAAAEAAVVAMAREEKAQAVFLSTADVALAAGIIKAIRSASPPLNVTIFGGDALMTPTLAARAGPAAAAGVRGADLWSAPAFRREFEAYAASQRDAHPGVPRNMAWNAKAATAYDATIAILDAARRAPPPRRGKQIAKELRSVRFDGKSGLIAFEPGSGDLAYDPATAYSVGEFGPDGAVAVLPAL